MRITKLLSIAALVVASFAACVLVFEIALRLAGFDPLLRLSEGRERMLRPSPHPLVRYELVPGASGSAWGTRVAINDHGFRGPDVPPTPRPDYRVLVLGDSIAFGNFLGVRKTFSYQLQQLLDADPGDFQVLNFAVGGYDTLQEVAVVSARGLEYQPDLVIVTYCLNDIGVISTNLALLEQLELRRGNPLFRLRSLQFVMDRIDRFRLRDWVDHKNDLDVFRREYAEQIDRVDDDEEALLALMDGVSGQFPSPWYRSSARVGRLRFALGWLADLSEREGFSVLVTIIPRLEGDASSYPHTAAHRIVQHEARRAGFEVIDFTEPFMKAGMENLVLGPIDRVHPNGAGHRLIAATLAREVRARARRR
ncbi:MAG: SGNH/GDSL hydrolase family protein [Deltaproteobacteria bacterium]|nr:SGNH/GDSL hydrolase family protein [Deltaproteobacteria bacterium]MBW2419843.1 SGNH/GDSL hydrolase family protein [Deltaproteobacteria bacterium]